MLTLYTKDYCPYCVMAKNLLTSIGATYAEVDVTNNQDVLMEIVRKSGMRTVPQIFFGEECLGGYTDIAGLHADGKLVAKLGL